MFAFFKRAVGAVVAFKDRAVASLVAGLALSSTGAHAVVIDTAAATTGITNAQVAVLVVLGAMITMSAAVYGVKKILRLLGR